MPQPSKPFRIGIISFGDDGAVEEGSQYFGSALDAGEHLAELLLNAAAAGYNIEEKFFWVRTVDGARFRYTTHWSGSPTDEEIAMLGLPGNV